MSPSSMWSWSWSSCSPLTLTRTNGDFWDYDETSNGIHRKVHRKTVKPAQKVVNEWASLIFDDDTTISCEDTACNEWLNDTLDRIHFKSRSQGIIAKGFALHRRRDSRCRRCTS